MSEPVLNQFKLLNWMYFNFFAGEILTVMSLISMYYSIAVVGPGLRPIKVREFFPNANSLWKCRLCTQRPQVSSGHQHVSQTSTTCFHFSLVSAPPTHTVCAAHVHSHLPTPSAVSVPPTTCCRPPPHPSCPCRRVPHAPATVSVACPASRPHAHTTMSLTPSPSRPL